jgi:hypothetical protein
MVQRRLQLLAQDAVLGEVVIVGTEELMMAQQEQTTARLGAALVDVIRLGSVEKTEPAEQKQVTGTKCGVTSRGAGGSSAWMSPSEPRM